MTNQWNMIVKHTTAQLYIQIIMRMVNNITFLYLIKNLKKDNLKPGVFLC
jgi:hypothetical protein